MKACIVPGCTDKQHQYGYCEKHRATATVRPLTNSLTPRIGRKITAANVYPSEALMDGYREKQY